MPADTTTAKAALAERAKGVTIFALIDRQQEQVARAIGSVIGAQRFTRNMLTTLRTTPKLAECSPESILGAMMQSAQLRLDPGPLQLVHFIPYKNKRTGRLEAQFQLGYRAYIELAYRAGIIITAHEVCEHDHFELAWGSSEEVIHVPAIHGDRGEIYGYYAVGRRDGQTIGSRYMSRVQVEQHRQRFSRSERDSPWDSDFDAMALKTVIRALASRLPLSVVGEEIAEAVHLDTAIISQDTDGVVDVEATEYGPAHDDPAADVDPETGELFGDRDE